MTTGDLVHLIFLSAPIAVLFLPWRLMWIFVAILILLSVAMWVYLSYALEAGEDAPGLFFAFALWLFWKGAIAVAVVLRMLNRLIDPDW